MDNHFTSEAEEIAKGFQTVVKEKNTVLQHSTKKCQKNTLNPKCIK